MNNALTYKHMLAGVALCLLTACAATSAKKTQDDAIAMPDSLSTATPVRTAIAKHEPFYYIIHANGKIKSLQDQVIMAEGGGTLLVCHAKPGAVFAAGALIAQLDNMPAKLRIERAELMRYNSEKEYESQLLGYENLLKDKDSVLGSSIKKKLRISVGLSGAEQDIREADYDILRSTIRAPFHCRVADVKVQAGNTIRAGQEMFRVYDAGNLLLEIKVLEAEIPMLKPGMPANISSIATPDLQLKAQVYDINPAIDNDGMAIVRLKLLDGSSLFPGMNCIAEIHIPSEKAVFVPRNAVVMRGDRPVVFTIENGLARWIYVITGKDNGKDIEIKDGLSGGEKVIISNNLQLAHGAPVREQASVADSTQNTE